MAAPGFTGRRLLIVALPEAQATGIHAGFPIAVRRGHPDYWPLFVGNVWFGAHRDGFARLYKLIREQRGYNYGAYSYIEHFDGRPSFLFPPPNSPRRLQYFSIWVRPVAHEYAPHLMKAVVHELDEFARRGLSERECALAKKKAKVLYLSLADSASRLLGSRLDDIWYGLSPGYLPGYLAAVEGVNCARLNSALRRHLQARDLKFDVVTDARRAAELARRLAEGGPAWGKEAADYELAPEDREELLRRDGLWARTPLELRPDDILVVPAARMFETRALPVSGSPTR